MRELEVMNTIQNQKEKDINASEHPIPLDDEGKELAEKKRFTFDIINIPTDPLR